MWPNNQPALRAITRKIFGGLGVVAIFLGGLRLLESFVDGRTSPFSVQASQAATAGSVPTGAPRPFSVAQEKELPWIYASDLFQDYQVNESAANAKYQWKNISVVCIVDSISHTDAGEPFATCKTKDENSPVYLHFDRAWTSELAAVQPGTSIVAIGRPNGVTMGSAHIECAQFRLPSTSSTI